MFKLECECGASNVIEEHDHLETADVEIRLDRKGNIEIVCCVCKSKIKSEQ